MRGLKRGVRTAILAVVALSCSSCSSQAPLQGGALQSKSGRKPGAEVQSFQGEQVPGKARSTLPPVRTAGGEKDDPVLDRKLREEQRSEGVKLLRAFPRDDNVLYLVGLIFNEQGNVKQALRYWKEAFSVDPTRADAAESIGYGLLREGRHGEAAQFLKKALQLKADFPLARRRLASCLLEQNKPGDVIKLLRGATRDPTSLYLLGQAYQQLGRLSEARRAYENAVALRRNYTEVYHNLAQVCLKLGHREAARKYLSAFKNYAAYAQRAGRQVRSAWNPLAITKVSVARTHTDLGRVYAALGRLDEAERLWQRARSLDPHNSAVRLHLAVLYAKQKRLEEAMLLYEEAAKTGPRSTLYYLNVGNIAIRLGQLKKAEAAYRAVIEGVPERSEGYFALAQLYLNTGGDPEEALQLAQKAVSLSPVARNYAVLARALAAAGRREEAKEAIGKALAVEPKNPVFLAIEEDLTKSP